jgi:hypothetical protein|nr:MAG TPA: Mitochondrial complex I, 51 kDa:ubiquinone, oxidoreductase, complex I, mammalian [Caudoviricetes sp.]
MREKLQNYLDKFEQHFPLMDVEGLTEQEIIDIIDRCIQSGKTYGEIFYK